MGERLGFRERPASRFSQYESNYRNPPQKVIVEIAAILDVNPLILSNPTTMDASEIMALLFWLDEFSPSTINLHQYQTFPGEKCNSSDDPAVYYHDNDSWPAHPPVGLWFNYGVLNGFMKEWLLRKEELKNGEITREEYFEWKINWPQTCDDCGKHEPKKQWRASSEP